MSRSYIIHGPSSLYLSRSGLDWPPQPASQSPGQQAAWLGRLAADNRSASSWASLAIGQPGGQAGSRPYPLLVWRLWSLSIQLLPWSATYAYLGIPAKLFSGLENRIYKLDFNFWPTERGQALSFWGVDESWDKKHVFALLTCGWIWDEKNVGPGWDMDEKNVESGWKKCRPILVTFYGVLEDRKNSSKSHPQDRKNSSKFHPSVHPAISESLLTVPLAHLTSGTPAAPSRPAVQPYATLHHTPFRFLPLLNDNIPAFLFAHQLNQGNGKVCGNSHLWNGNSSPWNFIHDCNILFILGRAVDFISRTHFEYGPFNVCIIWNNIQIWRTGQMIWLVIEMITAGWIWRFVSMQCYIQCN